jgi:hypothetical protein
MNASVVRTLVPAGAWRASSVRGGHTAHASSRAPTQTCIPTPKTERHTPVPRGDLRSISPSVPTFHGSRTARVKGRLEREVDRTPKFALDPELRLRSPWRVHGTGASPRPYADRNARSGSGLALEFELGLQGVRSCACSSGPRRGGLRSQNSPTIEVDQLERSTGPACAVPQNTAIWDSGAINAARQPEPVFGVLGANDVNLRR